MNEQTYVRISAAVDKLFRDLNGGKENGEYYSVLMPGTRYLFGIMRKFKAGHPLPEGVTKRYHTYGGITRKQCEIIEATSHDVAEISERIRLLIIDKRDTTISQSVPVSGIDPAELERRITERVNAILAARSDQPEKSGLIDRTRKTPGTDKRVADKDAQLWMTRCDQMGVPHPVLTPKGKVHHKWKQKAERLWAEFLKVAEPQTA